jgi:hypothetical protein
MVQPKYSPEEALQKIKLMMKYDSSKTLNENKQLVTEQDIATKTGIATAGAAGTAAALAGGAVAANVATTGTLGAATYGALGIGSALAPSLTSVAAATALGAGVVAGAAALALTPLVIWYMDKDNAKVKVEKIVQYCVTDKSKIDKIQPGLSEGEVRNLSDQLYDAMKGVGTNEEAVYGVFKSLKTASDFCNLVTRFNRDYGSEGDLLEWLDDDFDQTSEWMQIYRPIRDLVEDTLLSIKDENVEQDCKENPEQEKCKGTKPTPTKTQAFPACTAGSYKLGCYSDKVKQLQACLGNLVDDGKWGDKTQQRLLAVYPEYKQNPVLTDADIDKICKKTTQITPPQPQASVGGEEEIISFGADF